jgi:hypothetical protein
MLNGRHFLLLGIIACAGLVSVRDGQKQVELCYQIAALEKDLREVRSEIELCRMKHRALQSPRAVTTKASELQLKVAPAAPAEPLPAPTVPPVPTEVPRSLGSPQAARQRLTPASAPVPRNH